VCHSSAEICSQSNTAHHHTPPTVDMLTCPINQVSHNSVNPPQFQVVEERLEDIGALAERRRQRGLVPVEIGVGVVLRSACLQDKKAE
jgi:hypothetical protein